MPAAHRLDDRLRHPASGSRRAALAIRRRRRDDPGRSRPHRRAARPQPARCRCNMPNGSGACCAATGACPIAISSRSCTSSARISGATLELMLTSTLLAMLIGAWIGILGAIRRYSLFDSLATIGAMIALSIPTFWFGLVVIYVFSVGLGLAALGQPLHHRRWLLPQPAAPPDRALHRAGPGLDGGLEPLHALLDARGRSTRTISAPPAPRACRSGRSCCAMPSAMRSCR